jgi:hypothetical protein
MNEVLQWIAIGACVLALACNTYALRILARLAQQSHCEQKRMFSNFAALRGAVAQLKDIARDQKERRSAMEHDDDEAAGPMPESNTERDNP